LRELRDALESRSNTSEALRSEIADYFRSLHSAKIALKTDAKLLSGWSKSKIMAHRVVEWVDFSNKKGSKLHGN
jgi:hypothetical protein